MNETLRRIPLNFPNAPAIDEEFTASNGATYRWDGDVWMPVGSGRDVYLPLAGGVMEGTLVLDANPVSPMEAATKVYVDTIATGARMIIGAIDGTNGRCIYTAASGLPSPAPLVDASTVPSGSDVICVVAGTIPPDPLLPLDVWNIRIEVGDVLVSNGATWILIHIPRTTVSAGQVVTIPAVFGAANVQDALTQAALQDMPPGGAVGQILTKRVGADYDTEWTDASDPVNYTNIFMNRTPGGSGAADPNNFPIGSQSIWMNNAPVNCPPMSAGNTVQGFWQINTYMSGATGLQQAIEHTNPSPGPSTILSMWIRPRGNLQTTWGPWVQQSISNTDGAFVQLTGDTMTGPLQIAAPLAGENQPGAPLSINGRLEIFSTTAGTFRYVNRNNDQGGLTWISSGIPSYVDWLIFNAAARALSINDPGGAGITIVNGTLTVTSDLSANAGSFSGPVTAATPPTNNAHLCNKGYVDQLFSAAAILIGVIDAGTGNCQFADGTVGPLPIPTGSRHYIICTRAGTVPGLGVTMRLGDELFDGLIAGVPGWILIAIGTGGILTTADQVALIPNVAGTNNVQAGMQVLNTNKVEKSGDVMTGRLAFDPPTGPLVANPPSTTTKSTGTRLQLWGNPNAANDTNTFGIGVENGSMWFNCAAANNGFKFYNNCVLSWNMNNQNFDSARTDVGRVGFQVGTATQCGYVHFNTLENTRRGYIGYKGSGNTLIMKAETGWNWEITEALPYLNLSGALLVNMAPNTEGIRLRKNNTTANTTTPRLKFEASDGRAMGWIFGMQLGGNGYYGTWPSQMRCSVGLGGFGEQTCWTSVAYGGGWVGLRVEGDLSARSYFNNSDASLKSDIVPLDPAAAQKAFESLSPVQFHWKPKKVEDPLAAPHGWRHGPDEDPDSRNWGFLAQDIEKGAPHLVQGSLGSKSYDLAGVIAVLCSKLKSMEDELHYLKAHTFSDDIDTKEHARRVLWPHSRTHKAKH